MRHLLTESDPNTTTTTDTTNTTTTTTTSPTAVRSTTATTIASSSTWSKEEDDKLEKAVNAMLADQAEGDEEALDWDDISNRCFPLRSAVQCLKRFNA